MIQPFFKKIVSLAAVFLCVPAFARELPSQPTDANHPGSSTYEYSAIRHDIKISGRDVTVFLPGTASGQTRKKFPVVVYGHGQALDIDAYDATMMHLARKGIASIFPTYDTGFFDRDWRRMAKDWNNLTAEALNKFENDIDRNQIVFSGHSKGGYIALMAAGAPNLSQAVTPKSIVLFAPAGYDAEYIQKVSKNTPVTVIWGQNDSIIKRPETDEIYNKLTTINKQFIEVLNYPGTSLEADHFYMMNKSYFFGGVDGLSALHYYGAWKWLVAAVLDVQAGSKLNNPYIYGDQTASTGWSDFNHKVKRSANLKIDAKLRSELRNTKSQDVMVYLKKPIQLNSRLEAASKITVRTERINYVRKLLISYTEKSQKRISQFLTEQQVPFKAFYIQNALHIPNASNELIIELSKFDEVNYLKVNARAGLVVPPKLIGNLFDRLDDVPGHIERIGASKAWREFGVRGKGIVIAGQDTGYYWQHNAIKNQYRGLQNGKVDHNYNWHDSFNKTVEPQDDDTHGTHTMGTMVGYGGGNKHIGVAPEAQWIGCRNMDRGVGTLASYLECFEFFLAPYPIGGDAKTQGRADLAPHIINNSWACPPSEGCSGGDLYSAVQSMEAAGILVVAAAGNSGPDCSSADEPPGFYSKGLISVGAYNRFMNDIASFSSRGPSTWDGEVVPHVVAPGDIINSSVPGSPDSYDEMSGTSMASPQIAGVAALLWSAEPKLIGQIEKTIEILKKSSNPLTSKQSCGKFNGGTIPNATFGHGHINAYEAIRVAKQGV